MKLIYLILLTLLISCGEDNDSDIDEVVVLNIPDYFPQYTIPDDNKLTPDRIKLGEKIFNSNLLSKNNSMSCASCHLSDVAFANNLKTRAGVFDRPGTRNVPSIFNVIFQERFLREGSVPTLEQQALVPVQEHNEFDNDWETILERLNSDTEFRDLLDKSKYIFPSDNKLITEFNVYAVIRPLAAYQRTLLSVNSKYDKHIQNKINLTSSELLGEKLFKSDSLNCSKCHSGVLFSDYNFYNNGLYESYKDVGRNRFTLDPTDIGKFKVPSLRNVEITYPYMHDGSVASLEEVISHYEKGGYNHQNKSQLIKGFKLSQVEKVALIDFLKTLTEL